MIHSIFKTKNQWKKSLISDVARISTGSSNTQDKDDTGKYPFFIRSQNIAKSNKYIYDGEAVLTIGDGQIGKVFHYYVGKFDCHQRVYMLTDIHNTSGKYLYHYFSSFFYDRAIKMSAKNTVDSVRMDMIADMPIHLPGQEMESKIVNILDSMDNYIAKQESFLSTIIALKTGIIQKMFI